MSESSLRIETKLVHAGEPLPRILGAVEMPIFQSATFEYGGEGSYHDVRYLRTNNTPSQLALQAKIAALENARSEEHTSELQSRENLVCRLLLEKKKM